MPNYLIVQRSIGSIFRHSIRTFPLLNRKFSNVIPFKLADIGEGIAEVELMKWFVREGDIVKSFDRICEVQSDKATVEITSRYDGTVSKVYYSEGAMVKVGSPLIDILPSETNQPKLVNEDVPQNSASKEPSTMVTTDALSNTEDQSISSLNGSFGQDKHLTTPAVRKLAKENNINLDLVQGTGPKGRILKEDVLNYLSRGRLRMTEPQTISKSTPTPTGVTVTEKPATPSPQPVSRSLSSLEDKKVPIRGIQRLMVKSMNAANEVKHLTLGEEVNCNELVRLRKTLKSLAAKQGIKLSYMPILIKATSMALLQYPMLNATVNEDASEMTYHANHNIGVAIDTPKGLIVPVIKQVQFKSILDIAVELNNLQEDAAKGKITEAQLSGGTFSLSNIGSIGGTYAVPVLVMPQVCIGAIGRLMTVPRYIDDDGDLEPSLEMIESGKASVKPTTLLNISWSADHRVIDGATVARFSNTWKSYIESPISLLANLK